MNNQSITNSYEYAKDRLDKIIHNGFSYHFIYDNYGNQSSIKVGDQSLASYQYGVNNGHLSQINYGNGDTTDFTYDSYGNIVQVAVGNGNDRTARYQWYADNSGNLIKHEDLMNKLLYRYEYDAYGRLIRQDVEDTTKALGIQRNAYLLEYGYDVNDNITRIVNKAGSKSSIHTYAYGADDLLTTYTMPTGKSVTYTYDGINRLQQYQIGAATPITVDYSYFLSKRNAESQSLYRTSKVHYETVGDSITEYTYDELGNITSISEKLADGNVPIKNTYEYDELNQLIRETDGSQSLTKVYTYDLGGNIIKIEEYKPNSNNQQELVKTNNYEYTDSNWKDKLTSYNGQPITYDAIGNPVSYNGYTFSWSNGRELTTLSGNGVEASYTYDADGLRATKTVNGVKATYEYVGGQLLYEKKGNTELHYLYDTNGSLKGIQTVDITGAVVSYYVVTNIRGDITRIYDEAGNLKVRYTYDTWGEILSIKDSNGNEITDDTNIGKLNSLRYRGYYYDTETGFYYLKSRYYNPEWGRFINADLLLGINSVLLSNNVFAYCVNNPVNSSDSSGNIAPAVIYAAYLYVSAIITSPDLQMDLYFLEQDMAEGDYLAAALDIIGILAPGGTGVGKLSKPIRKVVNKVLKWIDSKTIKGLGKGLETIIFDGKQLGKKWGEHMKDYPQFKSYIDYRKYADDILHNYDRCKFDATNNEWYYIKGNDLLRLKPDGTFISLYLGANSPRVTSLK